MQQATCAHSGADTGTSPGNFRSFFSSRRSVLVGLAAAPAMSLPIAAPVEAQTSLSWARAEANYVAASKAAADYFETFYNPFWKKIEASCGPQPAKSVTLTFLSGQTRTYGINRDYEFPPFKTFEPCREAQKEYIAWSDRHYAWERDPHWSMISDELDRLYDVEWKARELLMNEPVPNAQALALKVQLAFEGDELRDGDRASLLADAARLTNRNI